MRGVTSEEAGPWCTILLTFGKHGQGKASGENSMFKAWLWDGLTFPGQSEKFSYFVHVGSVLEARHGGGQMMKGRGGYWIQWGIPRLWQSVTQSALPVRKVTRRIVLRMDWTEEGPLAETGPEDCWCISDNTGEADLRLWGGKDGPSQGASLILTLWDLITNVTWDANKERGKLKIIPKFPSWRTMWKSCYYKVKQMQKDG